MTPIKHHYWLCEDILIEDNVYFQVKEGQKNGKTVIELRKCIEHEGVYVGYAGIDIQWTVFIDIKTAWPEIELKLLEPYNPGSECQD